MSAFSKMSAAERGRYAELCADVALWGELDPGEVEEFDALRRRDDAGLEPTAFEATAGALAVCFDDARSDGADAGGSMPAGLVADLARAAREFVDTGDEVADRTTASSSAGRAAGGSRSVSPVFGLVGWVLAAAALVVAGVQWSWSSNGDQDPTEQRAALLALADSVRYEWAKGPSELSGSVAGGDVVWSPSRQAGVMRFRGLPANDATAMQYQLWIFDKGRAGPPVDGGVFDVPAGQTEVLIPIDAKIAVLDAAGFAVTCERPGGVVVSDREHIVRVANL